MNWDDWHNSVKYMKIDGQRSSFYSTDFRAWWNGWEKLRGGLTIEEKSQIKESKLKKLNL